MAHFNWGYAATSGDWSAVTVIDRAWLTTIDQNQEKAINGDEGGTWAPSSVITIGGDGVDMTGQLTVTGEFSASDILDCTVTGQFDFDAGSVVNFYDTVNFEAATNTTFASGADVVFNSGADLLMSAGSVAVLGGSILLATFPSVTSQTVYKRGLHLLSTTNVDGGVDGGATSPVDAAALVHSRLYTGVQYPTIVAHRMSGSQSKFWLEVPGLIQGATLAEVEIITAGQGTTPTVTFPQYTVQRQTMASAGGWPPMTVDLCSLATADAHQVAATWSNDVRITTVTCYQNNIIDEELYSYAIECTTPDSSSATTKLNVLAVMAKYTVTSLRP